MTKKTGPSPVAKTMPYDSHDPRHLIRYKHLALVLALLVPSHAHSATLTQQQGAAQLTVTARKIEANRLHIRLSDQVHVTVRLTTAAKPEVMPGKDIDNKIWHLEEMVPAKTTTEEDGTHRWRITWLVEPQQPGTFDLQPPSLKYREKGKSWQQIDWQPISVTVTTSIKDPQAGGLNEIVGIEELPPRPRSFVMVAVLGGAGGVVLLGLMVLLGWYLLRRRRARPLPVRQPIDAAREDLAKLATANLADSRDMGEFLSRLAGVLRVYLENSRHVPVGHRTSAELLELLARTNRLAPEPLSLLEEIFRQCDLGKFAPLSVAEDECHHLVTRAQAFLECDEQTLKT